MNHTIILLLLVIVSSIYATPTLKFVKQSPFTIIFGNNPEQLFETELCDVSGVSILELPVTAGSYRHFWEYLNQNSYSTGFLISITNDGTSDMSVLVHGGGHCESWVCSGDAIASMFNNYTAKPVPRLLRPGQDLILLNTGANALQSRSVETGILDVTLVGDNKATFRHILYRDLSHCNLHAPGLGYILRHESDGEDEGSVYKGYMRYSHAVASLDLVIPAGTSRGTVLPVAYSRFNVTTRKWTDPIESKNFITNIIPAWMDGVTSDMVPIEIPNYGTIYPDACCDGRGTWPNFGNWAVEYDVYGTVTNNDATTHTTTISFPYPGCDSAVAYKQGDYPWQGLFMKKQTDTIYYVSVDVKAGQTVKFSGSYMLGGPSCGGETHTIIVT